MKRVMVILIAMVVLSLTSCELCSAQVNGIVKVEKSITTSVDTTTITERDYVPVELHIFNDSLTDTLLFRTNNEATWGTVYDSTNVHFNRVYAKKLFLKAKSGSGINVRVWAN